MLRLSHTDMSLDSNRKTFYHFALGYFYNSASFKSNDATLQQLKSTGDYRLIEKDHVADSLTRYEAEIHSIYTQGDYYEVYFKEILSRLDELTDMSIYTDTSFIQGQKFTGKPLPLLRGSDGKLPTFFNKVFDFNIIVTSYAENLLQPQLDNATRLIVFLQKEYGIKE